MRPAEGQLARSRLHRILEELWYLLPEGLCFEVATLLLFVGAVSFSPSLGGWVSATSISNDRVRGPPRGMSSPAGADRSCARRGFDNDGLLPSLTPSTYQSTPDSVRPVTLGPRTRPSRAGLRQVRQRRRKDRSRRRSNSGISFGYCLRQAQKNRGSLGRQFPSFRTKPR
jgi:hypothetical protein